MTCCVAVKEKDRIVIGSDRRIMTGNTCESQCTMGEPKTRILGAYTIAAAGDYASMARLFGFEYPDHEPTEEEFASIAREGDDSPEFEAIVVWKNHMWLIDNTGAVVQMAEDYLACGSGAQVALGALHATAGQDAVSRAISALRASACHNSCVGGPFDFVLCRGTSREAIGPTWGDFGGNEKGEKIFRTQG